MPKVWRNLFTEATVSGLSGRGFTQKLSEIFLLKTQLHEGTQSDPEQGQSDRHAADGPTGVPGGNAPLPAFEEHRADAGETGGASATEERIRAELLAGKGKGAQNEAQASAFETERSMWQNEKEKVIRYQKELQASYLEMYHKNEALERETWPC